MVKYTDDINNHYQSLFSFSLSFSLSRTMKRFWLNCQTSYSDRVSYVRLWMGGMSARAIARRCHTSVTTVCRWLRRWRLEGSLVKRNHSRQNCKFRPLPTRQYHQTGAKCTTSFCNFAVPAIAEEHYSTDYNGNVTLSNTRHRHCQEFDRKNVNYGLTNCTSSQC